MPTNRLAKELSPYLVQHAHNPVDWYPWGEEALARARAEDKPILLSIGYSACHWCHVMEAESFSDVAIATRMNERFVCIKVDREERPDLDQVYQLVVQLMGRSGGWPLTVFLTPEQKPFFGGTYFPPVDRYGMPSFKKLLTTIGDAWRDEREDLVLQAAELTRGIAKVTRLGASTEASELTTKAIEDAASEMLDRSDGTFGGFGMKPKFPNTMALSFLLAQASHAREKDGGAAAHVRLSLQKMRAGGVYDHLGGGFHRYSTDERWLVPHFEKMLYDNALLLRLYTDGYRFFGEPWMKETALEIARYVLREMTDATGAFYSTEDADSEGVEGKFFAWSLGEVRALLVSDPVARDVAIAYFGITEAGNFEESLTTVLSEQKPLAEVATSLALSREDADAALRRAKAVLLAARENRVRPFRDEKVLTSWNALMIGALADASTALGDASLLAAAARAFEAVRTHLTGDADGALEERARTWPRANSYGALAIARLMKDGVTKGSGFLDDYAFLADAALDLYEVTGTPDYALFARRACDALLARFHTDADGLFFTEAEGVGVIVRAQDAWDSAIPSGTAVACRALLRLGALLAGRYATLAEKELLRTLAQAKRSPLGMAHSLLSLDSVARGTTDVVLVGDPSDDRTRALAVKVHSAYMPGRVLAWVDPSDPRSSEACAALALGKPRSTEPAAYVCRDRTCSLPVHAPPDLGQLLLLR